MRVVGVDLSLTTTGVATTSGGSATVSTLTSKPLGDSWAAREARLGLLAETVADAVGAPELVVLEGPSYGSRGGHQHDRAGLWWLVYSALAGISPLAVVPPSTRARYATGRGNAAKDAVLAAVVRRYADVEVTNNDEADALVMAAMGVRWLGAPLEDSMPAANLDSMAGVAWPV